MKILAAALLTIVVSGCLGEPYIAEEKSQRGNLEINVVNRDQIKNIEDVELMIDNLPMGNLSKTKPILYLTNTRHVVQAKLAGYKTVTKEIRVLGEPNHQILNIIFEKE